MSAFLNFEKLRAPTFVVFIVLNYLVRSFRPEEVSISKSNTDGEFDCRIAESIRFSHILSTLTHPLPRHQHDYVNNTLLIYSHHCVVIVISMYFFIRVSVWCKFGLDVKIKTNFPQDKVWDSMCSFVWMLCTIIPFFDELISSCFVIVLSLGLFVSRFHWGGN